MNVLSFELNGNRLRWISGYAPTAGEIAGSKCRFEFDSDWPPDTAIVSAVFWSDPADPKYAPLTLSDGVGWCKIPAVALNDAGELNISLVIGDYNSGALTQFADGVDESTGVSVVSSTIVSLRVEESAVSATVVEQPSLSLYAAMLQKMNDYVPPNNTIKESMIVDGSVTPEKTDFLSTSVDGVIRLSGWEWDSPAHQVTRFCNPVSVEQNTIYSIPCVLTEGVSYIIGYDASGSQVYLTATIVGDVDSDDAYSTFNTENSVRIVIGNHDIIDYIFKGSALPEGVLHKYTLREDIEVDETNLSEKLIKDLDIAKIAYDHSQTQHAPADAEPNQNAFSQVEITNSGSGDSYSSAAVAKSEEDTLRLHIYSGIKANCGSSNNIHIYGESATTTQMGMMSSADKKKLDGIPSDAEPNQNAFSKLLVGTGSGSYYPCAIATKEEDDLFLRVKSGVRLNYSVNENILDLYGVEASNTEMGMMSAKDKKNLDDLVVSMGDIDTAVDSIIAIEESLMGGGEA